MEILWEWGRVAVLTSQQYRWHSLLALFRKDICLILVAELHPPSVQGLPAGDPCFHWASLTSQLGVFLEYGFLALCPPHKPSHKTSDQTDLGSNPTSDASLNSLVPLAKLFNAVAV